MTSPTLRHHYIIRWSDLSHDRQKRIAKRNSSLFQNFLERHNLAVCESCKDMFLGDECPNCNPPAVSRYDVNDEISRERDREIYVSCR